MSYRLKVFSILTSLLVAALLAWQLLRHRSLADERAAWAAVMDSVGTQKTRIDSLESLLAGLDEGVSEGKRQLGTMQERITHYERSANQGRLPTPQFRAYMATIEDHNDLVARYNTTLIEMQRIYREYSLLIDVHNALLDSANVMQRRAVQEGYTLPQPRFESFGDLPRR